MRKSRRSFFASQIKPKETEWLIKDWLPLGSITLVDGDPGATKSTLADEITACVTTGKPFLNGSVCEPGHVVLIDYENGLANVIKPARANLATNEAAVEFDPKRATRESLIEAVRRAGYGAASIGPADATGANLSERGARELSEWRWRLICALILLAPILAFDFIAANWPGSIWVQLAAATALELYVGWPFLVGAYRRALRMSTNMDTLVAIGTLAAYGANVAGMITRLAGSTGHAHGGQAMYLMDAGIILTFITLGKYLEARAKGRASAAIRKLIELAPEVANVNRDGRVVSVPPAQVAVGETLVVRPGERIPLDAEVLSGSSAVDEAWLTGESVAVDKRVGDKILAGTINGQGALAARVLRPAGQTALAQVISLVRRAQESKTEIQRLADRVVSWFVPLVLAVAGGTILAWGLLGNDWPQGGEALVAVLVVACPCALGLATPTAILVASGRGAELGILIKNAHALELAGRLTIVVLDKTGTLTLGKPRVTRVAPAAGVSPDELLGTAAAVEQLSRHPLAEPIVAHAREQNLRLPGAQGLEIVPGLGVCAQGKTGELLVGNERLLSARGIAWTDQAAATALRNAGQTPLVVAKDGHYLGLIAVADVVRPHSSEAIATLRAMGLNVMLLSGDHRSIAERVAREVGIDSVLAEVLPDQKQAVVAQLRDKRQVVAMVGDGINDAPALVAADLGIAIGSGSDIAIEAADIVIATDDLRAVARAISLGRATMRTIKQNLGWAFAYNVVLIPVAAGALVPWLGIRLWPVAAAAAMALSSVSVVTNSLLLRARKLR